MPLSTAAVRAIEPFRTTSQWTSCGRSASWRDEPPSRVTGIPDAAAERRQGWTTFDAMSAQRRLRPVPPASEPEPSRQGMDIARLHSGTRSQPEVAEAEPLARGQQRGGNGCTAVPGAYRPLSGRVAPSNAGWTQHAVWLSQSAELLVSSC
jgi:hypothetical protein